MTTERGIDLAILARSCLTPKELEAYELAQRGLSERTIALALNISRSAVQSRLENAARKLREHSQKRGGGV